MHEGIWRSPKPTEEQQPIPGLSRIRPPRRGPTFPEGESGIPYIDPDTDAAISLWFQQNLDFFVAEYAPATDDLTEVTARLLDPNLGRTSKRKQGLYRVHTVTDVAADAGSERGTIRRLALKVETKSSV